jgi:hypothetical protein
MLRCMLDVNEGELIKQVHCLFSLLPWCRCVCLSHRGIPAGLKQCVLIQ